MTLIPNPTAATTLAPVTQTVGAGGQIPPTVAVGANTPDPTTTATTPAVGQPTAIPGSGSTPAISSGGQPSADPRAAINSFAAEVGFPAEQLAQFNDLASAQAAVRLYAESLIRGGQQQAGPFQALQQPGYSFHAGGAAPATYPQFAEPQQSQGPPRDQYGRFVQSQPVPPVQSIAPLDIKAFGLDEDEPAAKAIRALEKQIESRISPVVEKVTQTESQFTQYQEAQAARQQAALQGEANKVVDSWASTEFGTSKVRNVFQQTALQQVYAGADAIATAEYYSGRPISPIGNRLALAKLHYEASKQGVATVPQTPVAATPTPPANGSSSAAFHAADDKGLDPFSSVPWSENPAIKALIAAG